LGRSITARDGALIPYHSAGEGPPVLLVHGWGVSGAAFAALAARLGAHCSVVTPDLRGHGGAPGAGRTLTIEALADDIADLIEACGIEDVVAVGWSLGALVMWDYLARYGDARIGALIVADMSPKVANAADWSLGMQTAADIRDPRFLQSIAADWPGAVQSLLTRIAAPGATLPMRAQLEADAVKNDGAAMAAVWAALSAYDARPHLAHIQAPTWIAHGAHSQLYAPQTAAAIVAAMPRARAVKFERSGHAPHLEEPEAFARLVMDVVAQTKARRCGSTPKEDGREVT
jgi:pimeloyl-ACP methyl ester carboxylesterase